MVVGGGGGKKVWEGLRAHIKILVVYWTGRAHGSRVPDFAGKMSRKKLGNGEHISSYGLWIEGQSLGMDPGFPGRKNTESNRG